MGCELSASELRYGGGELSADERELLGSIEWYTQLRGLATYRQPRRETVLQTVPGNRGARFQAEQGEMARAEIVDFLRHQAIRATTKEVAKYLEFTDSGARNHMRTLEKAGVVRQLYPRGPWELV